MVMLVIIPLIVQVSGRSHFFEIDSDILEAVLSLVDEIEC
jgi:hypothetical protein